MALSGNHTAAFVVEAAEQLEVVLLDVLLQVLKRFDALVRALSMHLTLEERFL